jgi:dihydroorotate dehydrogenase
MNLEPEPGAEGENNVIATELAQTIESLNLSINQSELEEFVHIDDESNEEYAATMLEDVEELLESMKINEAGLDEDSDVNQPEQIVESHDRVEFHGFESLYEEILDIEDQLLYSNVQTEAEEAFDDFKKSFEEFQAKVRAIVLKARRKKNQNLRQMTIHDMFH